MSMPHRYVQLMAEIQALTLLPESILSHELVHLSVNGVDFSMYPIGENDQAYVVTHCDLGDLPVARRDAVLLRLLECNFHMINTAKPVSFCCNEESGRMMLSAAQPLSMLSGQVILDQMGGIADYALAWRETHFLNDSTAGLRTASKPQVPTTRPLVPRRFV
jgi:hypothetical protein